MHTIKPTSLLQKYCIKVKVLTVPTTLDADYYKSLELEILIYLIHYLSIVNPVLV
jgi:hypothetical protein